LIAAILVVPTTIQRQTKNEIIIELSHKTAPRPKMPKIGFLEGNLSALKSTILRKVVEVAQKQNGARVCTVPEPVDQWVRDGMLQASYAGTISVDQFQTYVRNSRAVALAAADRTAELVLAERSSGWSDPVFCVANGHACAEYEPDGKKHILINSTPFHCHKRLTRRARSGENVVGLDYLTKVDAGYRRLELLEKPANLLVLDIDAQTDRDGTVPAAWLDTCASRIVDFLST
jgi:hypothetical protein